MLKKNIKIISLYNISRENGTKHTANISFYHYRADVYQNETLVVSKYYYTLKEMCEEFETSTFTAYRVMKKNYKPTTTNLKGVKFFKDKQPAIITTTRPNKNIYGVLDDF